MRASLATFLVLLCGCTVEPNEGQQAQYCEALTGTDKFIIDPNDKRTVFTMTGFGQYRVTFVDPMSGYWRSLDTESMHKYRCKASA